MDSLKLLKKIEIPEFDYLYLIDILGQYKYPRDKIGKLIKSKSIIRVKKGIYVLGSQHDRPFSKYILANMIYGPSYISGYSALAYYGVIPERTETTSSTTPNRRKLFYTPVGNYSYTYLAIKKYQQSVVLSQIDDRRSFLIATLEKALVEILIKTKGIDSSKLLLDWMASMRIDHDIIAKLRLGELLKLLKSFNHKAIEHLLELVKRGKSDA